MRTITAAQAAVRASGSQADHARVQVKDAGGTWRDLTSYGFDALTSFEVKEDVASPHMTADVLVKRESFRLSLSPYVDASPLNRGFDPAASPVALLTEGREFKVEVAITPMDRAPSSGDWMEIFSGRIDVVDPAAGDSVRFGGRDKAGRIADQQIKKERIYGLAEVAGVAVSLRPWEPGMVVAVGEYMLPASTGANDSGAGKFFVCDVAGTTGNTEPTWSTGSNITDGSARWDYVAAPTSLGLPVEEVMQNLLDDNRAASDAAVTLYVPSSPGWAIKQFLQARERNLSAIRALALQIGWDVRMKWRAATSQFELTFFEPERAKATVDYTFAAADYLEPTKLETGLDARRNSWQLVYSDASDTWPGGTAKRKVVTAEDAASIAAIGEMWAEISEASASNIDSPTEAQAMVNAALSDCAQATADFVVPLAQGFPWVELGDRDTFAADGRRFDAARTFAVCRYSHRYANGKLSTELTLRGKPGLAAYQWVSASTLTPFVVAETRPPPRLSHYDGKTSGTVSTLSTPGGVHVKVDDGDGASRAYELHVSESSGFTPDDSTLKGVIVDKLASVQGLRPGASYYGKAVSRSLTKGKLARGQPGAEWAFTAGRVGSGMLERLATTGGVPNADFEDVFDPDPENSTTPPEHWTATGGTFGPSGDARVSLDSDHGRVLELRQTATSTTMASEVFRLPLGATALLLAAQVSPAGTLTAGRELHFHVDFFEDPDGGTPISGVDLDVPHDLVTAGTWGFYTTHVPVPEGAGYAQVSFYKVTASSAYGWLVGHVELTQSALALPSWAAATYASGWASLGIGTLGDVEYRARGGRGEVRGWATRASGSNTLITTLPAEVRPGKRRAWGRACTLAGTYVPCRVDVDIDGRVLLIGVGSGLVDITLDGLEFDLA